VSPTSSTALLLLLAGCGGGAPAELPSEATAGPLTAGPPATAITVSEEPSTPPAPSIQERLLPHDEERCELTKAYLRAHNPPVAEGSLPASCLMEPRLVVLHWTGSPSLESTWNTFAPPRLGGRPELAGAGAVNVSAHFLVDRDGSIQRLLPDERVARHVIGLNHLAIGIENVGGGPRAPLTEAQIEADVALVRHLAASHAITHLIGHHEYRMMEGHPYFQELDPDYRTAKSDPGEAFMEAVRARCQDLGLEGPTIEP
jgi:hypothetical protein